MKNCSKSKNKKQNKDQQEESIWRKCLRTVTDTRTIIGIVFSAVVYGGISKACDKLVPDTPVVVERIPDTVQVVHVYNPSPDSLSIYLSKQTEEQVNAYLKQKRSNKISDEHQSHVEKLNNKSQKEISKFFANKVFVNASFPNAKGYSSKSSAPYFTMKVSELSFPYVDFTIDFFSEEVLSEIYCLSLKVCKTTNERKFLVFDANYETKGKLNVIRINNIFSSDEYEVEVGFFLSKDRDKQYPDFYRESRVICNKQN